MLNTIFIIAVVLVIGVLLVIFRVTKLVEVVKGNSGNNLSGNKLQGLLLLLFMIFGIAAFFYYSSFGGVDDYTQPIASEQGELTDGLFWTTMYVTVFVFILTHILLFGFAWRYQHKEGNKADFYPHNNKLEMIWTIIPAIVLSVLLFTGLKAWNKITGPAPEGAEKIEVMGFQFAWAFRYGGNVDGEIGKYDFKKIDVSNAMGIDLTDQTTFDDFVAGQLVLPKGKAVELSIRARDVIHSVFNPHFRIQMNAVPGHPTRLWFVPTKTTEEMKVETGNPDFEYELVCNKICGTSHYGMRAIIKVLEQDEYDKWYAEQSSWLSANPEYMDDVPKELREAAKISAQIEDEPEEVVEMNSEEETTL